MIRLLLTFLLIFSWLVIPEFTLLGIPLFAFIALYNWPNVTIVLRYKGIITALFLYMLIIFIASIFGSNLELFYRIFLVNIVSLLFALSLLALRLSRLGIILLTILILECVVCIGQYHQLTGFWTLPDLLSDFLGVTTEERIFYTYEEVNRARGLHVLIHKAGPTMLFLFLACFSFYRDKSWFKILVIPVTMYGLFCVQSRSVVFALMIGVAYYVLFRKKLNIKAMALILLGILGFIFFSDSLNLGRFIGDNVGRSDIYRFQSYQYAVDNFLNYPLFGHAFDPPFTVHSVLLRILAEFGLIAGIGYLLFHALLWWSSKKHYNPRIFRLVVIVAFFNAQAHSSGLLFYDFTELPALILIYRNLL
jgi:hypothetical protein